MHAIGFFPLSSSTDSHVLFFSTASISTTIADFHSFLDNASETVAAIEIVFRLVGKFCEVERNCQMKENVRGYKGFLVHYLIPVPRAIGTLRSSASGSLRGGVLEFTSVPGPGYDSWACTGSRV